jgi:hypothetical protein
MSVSAAAYGTTASTSVVAAVVTVSGESVLEISSVATTTAGIRVGTDGFITARRGGSYTSIDTGTDWIIPRTAASSTYECRITSVSFTVGSGWLVQAAANDTWIDLSAHREWSVQDTNSGPAGRKRVSFTLEIRLGTGAVLDSGAFILEADYEV